MAELESALVGYILGVLVGSLAGFLLIGYIVVEATDIETPEFVFELYDWGMSYHAAHESWFLVAFILGVLSGLGGSGSAASRAHTN